MYAIIKNGGKQYKVQEGDEIYFDRMSEQPSTMVEFNEVLLIDNGTEATIGAPIVENAKVIGEVLKEGRDRKVVIFKKRRRKDSKRKRGFRRDYTKVKITKIEA